MDLVWLVVPVAVGIFALRAVLIARRLKRAAKSASLADSKPLRTAKAGRTAAQDLLDDAIAVPNLQLHAAKRDDRRSTAPPRVAKGLDAMVGDFLPERRL